MMHRRSRLGARVAIAIFVALATVFGTGADAAQHGFGFRLGPFFSRDGRMEDLVGVNTQPIFEAFYRFQSEGHALEAGVGFIDWERERYLAGGGRETGELEHAPITVGYRYHFFRRSQVSLTLGGGLGWLLYDATVTRDDGVSTLVVVNQSGSNLALEPVVGVELFPSRSVRIALEARYSWQVVSGNGGDAAADIDLTGWHTTLGFSFLFGPESRSR